VWTRFSIGNSDECRRGRCHCFLLRPWCFCSLIVQAALWSCCWGLAGGLRVVRSEMAARHGIERVLSPARIGGLSVLQHPGAARPGL
jgi:hypothetical protein